MDYKKELLRLQAKYDNAIVDIEALLLIEGKQVVDVSSEQTRAELLWGFLSNDVNFLYSLTKSDTEFAFSDAFTGAMGTRNRAITATEAKHQATIDPIYQTAGTLRNDVMKLRDNVNMVVDCIENRRWSLKSVIELTIAGAKETII